MRVFKRGKNWYADYNICGKRRMKSFGEHRKMAELFLKDIELKELRGELKFVDDNIAFKDFLSRYIEYSRFNKARNTLVMNMSLWRGFSEFLKRKGITKLKDIIPELIEEYKGMLLQTSGSGHVNNTLSLIKAMLNKAVQWLCLKENPLKNVKMLKNSSVRELRYLTIEEIEKIMSVSDPLMQKVITIMLNTGLRRSEFLYLQWEDMDFQNKLIKVQSKPECGFHPKSYKARSIPMNAQVEKILLDLPQRGKYVFDNGKNQPYHRGTWYQKSFVRILNKASIKNASLHTLRHSFASHLVMSGVDLRTVQELLGHHSINLTERYSHLSPDHRMRAVEKLKFETNLKQNSALGC